MGAQGNDCDNKKGEKLMTESPKDKGAKTLALCREACIKVNACKAISFYKKYEWCNLWSTSCDKTIWNVDAQAEVLTRQSGYGSDKSSGSGSGKSSDKSSGSGSGKSSDKSSGKSSDKSSGSGSGKSSGSGSGKSSGSGSGKSSGQSPSGARPGLRLKGKHASIELGSDQTVRLQRVGDGKLHMRADVTMGALSADDIYVNGMSLEDFIDKKVDEILDKKK